jgi:hypothetical protein
MDVAETDVEEGLQLGRTDGTGEKNSSASSIVISSTSAMERPL